MATYSLVFLFVLLFSANKVFADYENFRTLFTSKQIPATLGGPAWIFDQSGTVQTPVGATFTFKGAFEVTPASGGTPAKTAGWFWNHVKGNQTYQTDNVFLLRICKLDSALNPIDSQCAFVKIPYESRPRRSLCTHPYSTSLYVACSNNELDNAYSKSLYTYNVKNVSTHSDGTPIYQLGSFAEWTSVSRIIGDTFDAEFLLNIIPEKFYILPNPNASSLQEIPFTALYDNSLSSKYKADMWYCAAQPTANGNSDVPPTPSDVSSDDPGIKFFGRLCGSEADRPYFKIAETQTFSIPQSVTQVDPETNMSTVGNPTEGNDQGMINANGKDFLPVCDPLNGWRFIGSAPGTLMGCVAQITYHLIYRPINWFAGLMGSLFDFFLGYSLSDESYRAEFAVKGWELVRDISNIFFIVILVWTGLSAVFNTGVNMKRVVAQLILNAVLINFSLFGTRVVIDLSNIISRVFYNSAEVCNGKCVDADNNGEPDNVIKGPGGYKSLSTAITSGFNPQNLFRPETITSAKSLPPRNVADLAHESNETAVSTPSESETAGYFIIVTLIAALIMFAVAKMFWGVAFMFLGRVIGLYLVMIFSPFAVLTRGGMPLLGNIKGLSWGEWSKELTSYALIAPIFVFFLYIISSFITSGFMKTVLGDMNGSFFETVISISIPMLIVYFMLGYGVSIAKNYAGKVGSMVQGFVDKNIVGAVGAVAGGAAIGLRGASLLINKGTKVAGIDKWAAKNASESGFARSVNKALNWSQTSSMDIRNAGFKVGKKEITAGGFFTNTLGNMGADKKDNTSGALGVGQKDYLGGNVKIQQDRKKKKEEEFKNRIKYSHLSDAEAKEVWDEYTKKEMDKYAEKNWQDKVDIDDIANDNSQYRALKQKEAELKADLAQATSPASQITYQQSLDQNKAAQERIVNDIKNKKDNDATEYQKLQLQTIENLKQNDNYKNSKAYKDSRDEEKKNRFDEFGDIKDSKSLESAMRSEYARNVRQNSFWMQNGEPNQLTRWLGMSSGGNASAIAASLAGLGAIISGGIGGVVAAHIAQLQEEFDDVTKSVMNGHKKNMGKGTEIGKATERLKTMEDKIKKLYEKKFGSTIDDLSKATEAEIEEAIDEASDKLKVEINKLKAKPNKTNDDEIALAKAEREYHKLSDLLKDWDNQKTKVSNLNRQKKQDEEKGKEKDKPKDDKPK